MNNTQYILAPIKKNLCSNSLCSLLNSKLKKFHSLLTSVIIVKNINKNLYKNILFLKKEILTKKKIVMFSN